MFDGDVCLRIVFAFDLGGGGRESPLFSFSFFGLDGVKSSGGMGIVRYSLVSTLHFLGRIGCGI